MIRLAELADIEAVTACVMQAYTPYIERIGIRPGPMSSDYADLIARGAVHVLLESADIVGVLVLQREDDTLWVENVAIEPNHQHMGLGRQLLAFAEQVAQEAGSSELRLYTHELMVENITLYQRLGYCEVERREEFGFRRVFMRKPILKIREFQPGDGEGLAQVWVDAGRYYSELDPQRFQVPNTDGLAEWTEDRWTRRQNANQFDRVATLDGQIVGMVSAVLLEPVDGAAHLPSREQSFRRLTVDALGVRTAFWRLGIGRQLMQAAEAWARTRGAQVIVLDTWIHSPVSVPFYEQHMGYTRQAVVFSKRLRR
jgi:GNAT superfamily N-acetyltransferase